jgi:hypothetical protein
VVDPHLAKNERDTRISCKRLREATARAAFIMESRMNFINATKVHRKSGDMGHPSFVAGRKVNQFAFSLSAAVPPTQ